MQVGLVIIFNHRFDQNLDILRKLYRDRFSIIRFLMPFYDGEDQDVIPVYECSYQFQGYLIQAYDKLMQLNVDYYFFAGDDLLLNPIYDENNIVELLNIDDHNAFIPSLKLFNTVGRIKWSHSRSSSKPFLSKSTSWQSSLFDYNIALKRMNDYFCVAYPEEYRDDFFEGQPDIKDEFIRQNGDTNRIPYPMARGFSDFFMIHKFVFRSFARTCGIFSAMNLFVELAIPTAMILTCDRIKTAEKNYICAWEDERMILENKFKYSIDKLFQSWEKDVMFIHPVKLSMWKL